MTASQTFLVWADLDSWEKWSGVLQTVLQFGLVWCFLLGFGLLAWGCRSWEEDHRGKAHFHHITSRARAIHTLVTVDVVLGHLAEVAFAQLLCCQGSLFPFLSCSALQKESLRAAHTPRTGSYAAPPAWEAP